MVQGTVDIASLPKPLADCIRQPLCRLERPAAADAPQRVGRERRVANPRRGGPCALTGSPLFNPLTRISHTTLRRGAVHGQIGPRGWWVGGLSDLAAIRLARCESKAEIAVQGSRFLRVGTPAE